MIGVALYQEAGEILTESLAILHDRGDTEREAEALRLLGTIEDQRSAGPSGRSQTTSLPDQTSSPPSRRAALCRCLPDAPGVDQVIRGQQVDSGHLRSVP
jgi:hypothetical protein